jgi:hypothetical protein
MEVLLLFVGAALGAVPSWYISRYYYQRAAVDAADGLMAQRLDSCNEGDKSFLVAMAKADRPIPRYALIQVEYETIDGKTGKWGSNTSIMCRSLKTSAPHSLRRHYGSDVSEDWHTISLSDRGKENAQYLLRREYKSARFSSIDSSDKVKLGLFREEHKRDPRPGGASGVLITTG